MQAQQLTKSKLPENRGMIAKLREAHQEAILAAQEVELPAEVNFCCGFVWLTIKRVRRNQKNDLAMIEMGYRYSEYHKKYRLAASSISSSAAQSQMMETQEAALRAYAQILIMCGFEVNIESRID